MEMTGDQMGMAGDVTHLEAERHEVASLDRGMRARHRDELGVLRQQKVGAVVARAKYLEGTTLLELVEHGAHLGDAPGDT